MKSKCCNKEMLIKKGVEKQLTKMREKDLGGAEYGYIIGRSEAISEMEEYLNPLEEKKKVPVRYCNVSNCNEPVRYFNTQERKQNPDATTCNRHKKNGDLVSKYRRQKEIMIYE